MDNHGSVTMEMQLIKQKKKVEREEDFSLFSTDFSQEDYVGEENQKQNKDLNKTIENAENIVAKMAEPTGLKVSAADNNGDDSFDIASLTEEKLKDMWKDVAVFLEKEEGYIPSDEYYLKGARDELLENCLAMSNKRMSDYNNTLDANENETAETIEFIKSIGFFEHYKLFKITQQYLSYKKQQDRQEHDAYKGMRPYVHRSARIEEKDRRTAYVRQRPGSNDCFACSLSGIYNHFLVTENDVNATALSTADVRAYKPDYISIDELKKVDKEQQVLDAPSLEMQKQAIEVFSGKHKRTPGNILAISDIIFDKKKGLGRTDVALVQRDYNLSTLKDKTPEEMFVIRQNLKDAMRKEIHRAIASGQMVSMLSHGHYVTIIGIEDDKITYLDSIVHFPKPPESANVPKTMDFDTYLTSSYGSGYGTVELSYLKKIDKGDFDELKKEYGGLDKDKNTGEVIRTNGLVSDSDVAHRSSVVITKSYDEMKNSENADIADYISERICLHREAFLDKQKNIGSEKKKEGKRTLDELMKENQIQKSAPKKQKEWEKSGKPLHQYVRNVMEKNPDFRQQLVPGKLTDNAVESKVMEAYKEVHGKQATLSAPKRSSRVKAYKKKAALQEMVLNKTGDYDKSVKTVGDQLEISFNDVYEMRLERDTRVVVTSFAYLKHLSVDDAFFMATALNNKVDESDPVGTENQVKAMEDIFSEVLKLDLREFNYNSVNDLANRNLGRLMAISNIAFEKDAIFGRYMKLRGSKGLRDKQLFRLTDEAVGELNARFLVMQHINRNIRPMVEMIKSPYYARLANKDMADKSIEELDAALLSERQKNRDNHLPASPLEKYLKSLVEIKKNYAQDGDRAFGKGVDANSLLERERRSQGLK